MKLPRVVDGMVTDELSVLVRPPDNYYWSMMTDIHGLCAADTADAPSFDLVWDKIEPFISSQCVVAHNGPRFDFDVLKKTLMFYGLPVPDYEKRCTLSIYTKDLASLCRIYGIGLDHHDALSDARACAVLYLMHLNK